MANQESYDENKDEDRPRGVPAAWYHVPLPHVEAPSQSHETPPAVPLRFMLNGERPPEHNESEEDDEDEAEDGGVQLRREEPEAEEGEPRPPRRVLEWHGGAIRDNLAEQSLDERADQSPEDVADLPTPETKRGAIDVELDALISKYEAEHADDLAQTFETTPAAETVVPLHPQPNPNLTASSTNARVLPRRQPPAPVLTPSYNNNLPPAPNVPLNTPNLPPPPPHNPNTPPGPPFGPGPNGPNFNAQPSPNMQPTLHNLNVAPTPSFLRRERVVDRGSNFLTWAAIGGLLWERRQRKKADNTLRETLQKHQAAAKQHEQVVSRQSEQLQKQDRELRQQTEQIQTLTQAQEQQARHQRREEMPRPVSLEAPAPVAHVLETPGTVIRPFEAPTPSGLRAEQRPNVIPPSPRVAEQLVSSLAPEQFEPRAAVPEQRTERHSAWHNIVMKKDETGREVVDTEAQYGQGFQQERARELAPVASQGMGGLSTDSNIVTTSAPLQIPGVEPTLPSGMTNPGLPMGAPTFQDPQHLLPAQSHRVRSAATTVVLWVLVAIAAFAIVSGIRLLF